MRTLLFLAFVVVVLAACGGQSDDAAGDKVPTLAPTAVFGTETETNSPRATATPASSLPPTWTPPPAGAAGHSATPAPTAVVTRFIHIVQPGDSLGTIAEQYGVSLADLIDLNDITNPDIIEVGTQLLIPER